MDQRLFKPQVSLAVAVLFVAPGAYLLSKNSDKEPAEMRFEEIVQALENQDGEFRLVPVGVTDNPRLGFMVLRADDPRRREDLMGEMITRRRGYVLLRQTASVAFDDAVNLFRFRDGELSGDPEMIEAVVAALRS